jgi:hypothetical protein
LPPVIIEAPLLGAGVESWHLDNMDNTEMRSFLESGGYTKMMNHTLQDFYSHSNYIEIMIEEGYSQDKIPTFDKLDPKSKIFETVMSKIETTKHEDNGQKNGHDGVGAARDKNGGGAKDKHEAYSLYTDGSAVPMSSDNFMAKDANGGSGGIMYYEGFKHPLYDVAYRLAVEATVRKIEGTTINNAEVKKDPQK